MEKIDKVANILRTETASKGLGFSRIAEQIDAIYNEPAPLTDEASVKASEKGAKELDEGKSTKYDGVYHCAYCPKTFPIAKQSRFLNHQRSHLVKDNRSDKPYRMTDTEIRMKIASTQPSPDNQEYLLRMVRSVEPLIRFKEQQKMIALGWQPPGEDRKHITAFDVGQNIERDKWITYLNSPEVREMVAEWLGNFPHEGNPAKAGQMWTNKDVEKEASSLLAKITDGIR